MGLNRPNSMEKALVLDANIVLSLVAHEETQPRVSMALRSYFTQRYRMFAPGVLVSETLYVLCGKLNTGEMKSQEHTQSIAHLATFMELVNPSPEGDGSLVLRAEAIRGNYTCRRSADGIYIALAEMLAQTHQTVLLTFDEDMARQANKHTPRFAVDCLQT